MNYVVSDWKLFARLGHCDIGTLGHWDEMECLRDWSKRLN